MQCKHCYHDTGVMLLSEPPQIVEKCCHCGEKHHRLQSIFKRGKTHGPHLNRWQPFDEGLTIPLMEETSG
jgi:hypothetical protein